MIIVIIIRYIDDLNREKITCKYKNKTGRDSIFESCLLVVEIT